MTKRKLKIAFRIANRAKRVAALLDNAISDSGKLLAAKAWNKALRLELYAYNQAGGGTFNRLAARRRAWFRRCDRFIKSEQGHRAGRMEMQGKNRDRINDRSARAPFKAPYSARYRHLVKYIETYRQRARKSYKARLNSLKSN